MEVGIKANENLSSLGSEDVMQHTSSKVPDAEDKICNILEETNVFGAEAAEAKRNNARHSPPHEEPQMEIERQQESISTAG